MRIALFGKNGQVGRELQNYLPKYGILISLGREDLDVCNTQAVQYVLREFKPDLIVNASAYTEVDRAEEEPDLAMRVNAYAPAAMAEAARELNAVFIHYSTDYVFDGIKGNPYIEKDLPNPLNVYGKSKLAGEKNIEQTGDSYLILRTSWVYSMRGNTFVNKVLAWSRTNTTLSIVNDQIGNPTWASALAKTTSLIVAKNKSELFDKIKAKRGIYHLAGDGYASRFQWATQILANDPNRNEQLVRSVEPASSDQFPSLAIRPLFSALNCSKFHKTFNLVMPNWRKSLQDAMKKQ